MSHDWHGLRGLNIRRNLKRLCWHEAIWLYSATCNFSVEICILHPQIKCMTVTTHISTKTVFCKDTVNIYLLILRCMHTRLSADGKCCRKSCICIRICNKQLQHCISYVSFICVVIYCKGICRGRVSREQAGPSLMPPLVQGEQWMLSCKAQLCSEWIVIVSNVEKNSMCFQLDGQAVMSHSSLPWWLSWVLFLDTSLYTIWAAVVPIW